MINAWTDLKLKRDLLAKIKKSGGYQVVKHPMWGYYMKLMDKKGTVLLDAPTYMRAKIINEIIHAYDNNQPI